MLLGHRVAIGDVRILDAVQQHVHAADPQHGAVKIERIEQLVMKVLFELLSLKISGWLVRRYSPTATGKPQVPPAGSHITSVGTVGPARPLTGSHAEACGTGRSDRPRQSCPACTRTSRLWYRDYPWHLIDHIDDFGQQHGRRNREPRILHMMGIGRVIAPSVRRTERHVRRPHRTSLCLVRSA